MESHLSKIIVFYVCMHIYVLMLDSSMCVRNKECNHSVSFISLNI